MAYAVIRVRGQPDVNKDIAYTMDIMNLTRVNHCVVVPENDVMKGMLQKAKDYITWGEINESTLTDMIKVRGRLSGDIPVTDEYLAKNSEFQTVEEMAKALLSDYKVKDIEEMKPVFRQIGRAHV